MVIPTIEIATKAVEITEIHFAAGLGVSQPVSVLLS
jgi:hypothetical protein